MGASMAPMPDCLDRQANAGPKRSTRSKVPFVLASAGPTSARIAALVAGASLSLWCAVTVLMWGLYRLLGGLS